MSDLLEADLRAAFATRLEEVSAEREARLRAFDYRSNTARRRRIWATLGASSSALAAGIVAAILLLSSGTSVAYAGWTAVPTTPTPAALAAATSACNAAHSVTGPPVLTGKPVLTDARGRYTAAIYVRGDVDHVCISNGVLQGTSLGMSRRVPWLQAAPNSEQLGSPTGFGGGADGFQASRTQRRRSVCSTCRGLQARMCQPSPSCCPTAPPSTQPCRTAGTSRGGPEARATGGQPRSRLRPARTQLPRRCPDRHAVPGQLIAYFPMW